MSVYVSALTPVEEMAVSSVSVVVALATDANSAILVDRGGGLASSFFAMTDEKPRRDILEDTTSRTPGATRNAAALVQHNATATDGIINAFHDRAIHVTGIVSIFMYCSIVNEAEAHNRPSGGCEDTIS